MPVFEQKVSCWKFETAGFSAEEKKKHLHLLRGTVSSKDLNILSSAAVSLQEFGGDSLFP